MNRWMARRALPLLMAALLMAAMPALAEETTTTSYVGFLTGHYYQSEGYQSQTPGTVFVSLGVLGGAGTIKSSESDDVWVQLPEGMTEADVGDGLSFTLAEPIALFDLSQLTDEEAMNVSYFGRLPTVAPESVTPLSVVDCMIREISDDGLTFRVEAMESVEAGTVSPELMELTLLPDAYVNGTGELRVHKPVSGAFVVYDPDTMEALGVFHHNG